MQMWGPLDKYFNCLKNIPFDKTVQQNSCMQLQIVCLVSINCNELHY